MCIDLYFKCPLFLSDVNDTGVFSIDFRKTVKYQFHENPPSRSRIVLWGQTDRQTNRHDEANSRFLQFSFHCCAVFVINIVNQFVNRTRVILIITEILLIFHKFLFFSENKV